MVDSLHRRYSNIQAQHARGVRMYQSGTGTSVLEGDSGAFFSNRWTPTRSPAVFSLLAMNVYAAAGHSPLNSIDKAHDT